MSRDTASALTTAAGGNALLYEPIFTSRHRISCGTGTLLARRRRNSFWTNLVLNTHSHTHAFSANSPSPRNTRSNTSSLIRRMYSHWSERIISIPFPSTLHLTHATTTHNGFSFSLS